MLRSQRTKRWCWAMSAACVAAVALCLGSAAHATDYTWSLVGSGNWDATGAWAPVGPPNAAGDQALFPWNGVAYGEDPNETTRAAIYANPANAYAVSLNNQAWTIGGLQMTGTNAILTITAGGDNGKLIFSDPNGLSLITATTANSWLRFDAPVQLDNDVMLKTSTGSNLQNNTPFEATVFTQPITGTGRIYANTTSWNGALLLRSANSTFTGGIDISNRGYLILNAYHCAGTGPIICGDYINNNSSNGANTGKNPVLVLAASDEHNAIYGNDIYGSPYFWFTNGQGQQAWAPGHWSYQLGHWYPGTDPVIWAGKGIGSYGDSEPNYIDVGDGNFIVTKVNHYNTGHPVQFTGTTLTGGQLLKLGYAYAAVNLGKITGDGNIQLGKVDTWAGYAFNLLMSDPTTDMNGTITSMNGAGIYLLCPGAQGTAKLVLDGGTIQYNSSAYIVSVAQNDANADHTDLEITVASAGIIDGRQRDVESFYDPKTNDPLVVHHKFGALTVGGAMGVATIQFGGISDTNDTLSFEGEINLNAQASLMAGEATFFNGKVTGGDLVMVGGSQFVWLTNGTNDYGSTTITAGNLGLKAGGKLGTGALSIGASGQFRLSGMDVIVDPTFAIPNDGTFSIDEATTAVVGDVSAALPHLGTIRMLDNTGGNTSNLVVRNFYQNRVIIGAGATLVLQGEAGTRVTAEANSLTFSGTIAAPTGQLDIVGNYLVIRRGVLADVESQVASGMNMASGYWDGPGITSSLAAADTNFYTAVGVLNNALAGYTEFGDATGLTGSEILVRYTFYGDADLSGVVDFDTDYILWQEGFLNGYTGWVFGDFNHDGVVDFDTDYILWQTVFLNQPSLPAGAAAVPEPGTLALVGLGLAGLLGRRNRK